MHVHMLTCSELPDLNEDDGILRTRLLEQGHKVSVNLWNEPVPDGTSVVLIRSCWDYYKSRDYFIDCIRRIDLKFPIWNTPRIIEWNSDKVYLQRFEDMHIPILPTFFPGQRSYLPPEWECDEFIVKPRISNAGNNVVRLPRESLLTVGVAAANFSNKVMIQPFVKEISEVGEYSMIYIGGAYSHCVHKIPGKGDFRVQHMYGGSYELKEPDADLQKVAEKVHKHILEDVLYARLDFIPYQGKYCLSEAELIEPWLHFTEYPQAADMMIDCLEYRYLH